jgi:hypothetical protein
VAVATHGHDNEQRQRTQGASALRNGGQICHPSLSTNVINEFGSINGASNAEETDYCPVAQDVSGGLNFVNVIVYDRNRTVDVSCTLYRMFNGTKAVVDSKTSNGANTASQVVIQLNASSAGSDTLSLVCTVPRTDSGGGSGTYSGIQAIETVYASQ